MKLFSERMGITKPKSIIQKESIDMDLRVGLWNMLDILVWKRIDPYVTLQSNESLNLLVRIMWVNFFKYPLDTLNNHWPDAKNKIRMRFFEFKWYEVYNFIEFIANNYPDSDSKHFIDACNNVLEKELSAYRFVGTNIAEITSGQEINEIENAVENSPNNIRDHLKRALGLLSDKKEPDYRNSIKESISSVEAICRQISGNDKATLGNALDIIEKSGEISMHPALKGAFSKLYGYASTDDGIRHALIDKDKSNLEDARFMLIACSAFINYLTVKADKAGIKLE